MRSLRENFAFALDEWITESITRLPSMLTSKDLVELGVYKTMDRLANNALRGYGPRRVKSGNRYLYPRITVLLWMKEKAMRAWPQEEKDG